VVEASQRLRGNPQCAGRLRQCVDALERTLGHQPQTTDAGHTSDTSCQPAKPPNNADDRTAEPREHPASLAEPLTQRAGVCRDDRVDLADDCHELQLPVACVLRSDCASEPTGASPPQPAADRASLAPAE